MAKEEGISALAFNIGKQIEEIIYTQANQLQESNKVLVAKILLFRRKLHGEMLKDYDFIFGIEMSKIKEQKL